MKVPRDYRQPPDGYRFSRDSILLARFARPVLARGRAADLGAGCGAVGLEALAAGRLRGLETLFMVEADRVFEECLAANVADAARAAYSANMPDSTASGPPSAPNGVASGGADGSEPPAGAAEILAGGPDVVVVWADWRELTPADFGGPLDYALCNPPFFPEGASGGEGTPRYRARHETRGGVGDLLAAAKVVLAGDGLLALCWPRPRLGGLLEGARRLGFAAERLETVPRRGADLVLLEFRA
ncbi:MAG: hypothetical protein LBO05_12540 [Deltaproteobacteria bacterium]|jgi:tRNA1(Val) A37 N6-methylase TrmN6|nr:hypothetical protein [Deltaproteobacteria bacterium]